MRIIILTKHLSLTNDHQQEALFSNEGAASYLERRQTTQDNQLGHTQAWLKATLWLS